MERYRMIVTGKNKSIIDDIFGQLRDYFDVMSTSPRFDDILRHIDVFKPNVFVICLNGETPSEIHNFADLKRKLASSDVSTVIIGKKDECAVFEQIAVQMADEIIANPASVDEIRLGILNLLKGKNDDREVHDSMMILLEELKKRQEKKHVLVIDDDPLMHKLIKEYLGDKYSVAAAINGKIAYKFLEAKETNLILLDYEMPDENGVEVLEKIRLNPKHANIPIVFLTGVSDRERLYKVLMMKPQGYLTKPVDREKLIGTIEKFIG